MGSLKRFGILAAALLGAATGCASAPESGESADVGMDEGAAKKLGPATFDFEADVPIARGGGFSSSRRGEVHVKARITITNSSDRNFAADLEWLSGPLSSSGPVHLTGYYSVGEDAYSLWSEEDSDLAFGALGVDASDYADCSSRASTSLYIASPGRSTVDFGEYRHPVQNARVIFEAKSPCGRSYLGVHFDWLTLNEMHDVEVR